MGEEPLNLTCVANKSKPVQILAWFINGVRVSVFSQINWLIYNFVNTLLKVTQSDSPRVNLSQPDIDVSTDGLVSSSLGISLSLSTNDHLFNGVLTLRYRLAANATNKWLFIYRDHIILCLLYLVLLLQLFWSQSVLFCFAIKMFNNFHLYFKQ